MMLKGLRNMSKKPIALIIMDGFGYNHKDYGNAIRAAKTPNIDRLLANYPHTLIGASGMDVGLPEGQMGNSEVGHTNIGAGRIVYQELTRITKSIKDGEFFSNEAFTAAVENCKKNDSALHLFGLLSNGGVHSHNSHLYGLLELAKKAGLTKVYVHCFMDGRDVPPTSGVDFVAELEEKLKEIGVGKIATVMGRYYAMDRDNRWERVGKAYDAMVYGEGNKADNAVDAIKASYAADVTDEFVVPTVIDENGKISANDSVIFFNFRPDRAREITRTLVDDDFIGFERRNGRFPLYYVCMTQYDATMPNVDVAFKPASLENTFGEYIAKKGLSQLRIAETEKYAHVTFFFNGGRETPYDAEERILVPSPKVATYDLKPEMSAYEVKDKLVEAIKTQKFDFIVVNYANGDMVGHTGIYEAIEKAVKAIDECVKDTVEAAKANDYEVIIIADHGNADHALNEDGTPNTAHSLNPVPFVYVTANKDAKVENGVLADVAPSILHILGMEQPAEMTGKDLIK